MAWNLLPLSVILQGGSHEKEIQSFEIENQQPFENIESVEGRRW